MVDAKKGNAAKEFFEKFGEKLALVIALLILVGYGIIAFGLGDDDTQLRDVEKYKKEIEKEQKASHKEMTAPDTENWHAKAINPWTTVVASASAAPDWTGFLITKAEGKGLPKTVIKKIPVKIPPVAFGAADVAIDQISLSWTYKDFTPQEIQKMSREKEKTDAAKASHFVLERQMSGGKWEVLADKLDVKVQTFIDSKIEPKSKYMYRVTAYSTDKNFLERGGSIDPETGATANPEGKINTAMSAQVQTLGIWKITFSNAMKKEDAKGMVYVKIEKFEKGYGKVEKAHMQFDGDQIGFWEETAGGEPTSKHRVPTKGGKAIEVDFNMAATLMSVAAVKLQVDVKRCKAIYNPDGTKKECQQLIEKRTFDTHLVTYKDDEGVKKVHVPSPTVLDQLCEEHGGRKIVTTLPGDTKDKPEEPKVDPKEVARQKKEADAEKLFEMAEAALEKNKSLALTSYQRLLSKEYSETDFVSKNKKAIIEERVAALKSSKK
jgi:hypothetical protein